MTKRIGILTSGGDCAGLNATIRAVALRAHHGYGWTTIGIRYGTLGLLERPVEAIDRSIPTGSTRRWRARAAPSSAAPIAAIPSPFRWRTQPEGSLGRDGRRAARACSSTG